MPNPQRRYPRRRALPRISRYTAHLRCGCAITYPPGVPTRRGETVWCGYHTQYAIVARTTKGRAA